MKYITIFILLSGNLLFGQDVFNDTMIVQLDFTYSDPNNYNDRIIVKNKRSLIVNLFVLDSDNSSLKKDESKKIAFQKKVLDNLYIQNVDSVCINELYLPVDISDAFLNWDKIGFLGIITHANVTLKKQSDISLFSGIKTFYIASINKSEIDLRCIDQMKVEVLDVGNSNIKLTKRSSVVRIINSYSPSRCKVWIYQHKFKNLTAIFFYSERYKTPGYSRYYVAPEWFTD